MAVVANASEGPSEPRDSRVPRSTAQRILMLRQEADELEAEMQPLVTAMQPQLLALPGVGPISAAQVLIS